MAGQITNRGDRTWLVRVQSRNAEGKRISHNKTVHCTKEDAQRYLNGFLRDRDLGQYAPSSATVDELLDALLLDYKVNGKSLGWAAGVIRVHLRPFFGGMRAAAVSTDDLKRYVAMRHKPTVRKLENGKTRNYPAASNGTINREFTILRSAFNMGRKADPPKVTSVPRIPKLKENAPRKGFLEREAFAVIRQHLSEEVRPVVTFAYYTGCRKGEILMLKWPQVDLTEGVVRLNPGETKNDQARTIPLAPELREVLTAQKALRDDLFPSCPWVFFRVGRRILDFRGAWESACKKAGLINGEGEPEMLFHDLRRTGVRNLIRAGVPERVAMAISGHKTRSMLDRYNIVSEADLKDAAKRLGEYLGK